MLTIRPPNTFRLEDVVCSHGWLQLPPYQWDPASGTLARMERLPDGAVSRLEISQEPGVIRLRSAAGAQHLPELTRRARWMLALEDDLSGFHALCREEVGLREAGVRGRGRILRCPAVWEDLVKTLFSVNTTWGQTIGMTRRLVERYGAPGEGGLRAFPEPAAIAAAEPEELRETCRVGYRAGPLSLLARALADGSLDLEVLKDAALSDESVELRLRSLHGIGPYAAANMLLLLGRYDHLPVDSWFRKRVRDGWFGGLAATERELVAAFDRYRPYRALVYYFYDWKGALRTETWTGGG